MLFRSAERGHKSVVRLLIDRDDVDADSKDNDGMTPFSLAAAAGHTSVVQLLADRQNATPASRQEAQD